MSSKAQFLYYALWIAYPVLQSAVAGIMVRRKLRSKFPVFFAYLIAQVLIFAILFPIWIKSTYEAYFDAYWITAAMSLALGFSVIHEIFVDVFRPYHTLKDLGTVLFKWAGLVMLLAAMVVAAASTSTLQGPLVQAVLTVERCVRVIQCGLVLFLLLFARYLGVSWRQQNFGIAVGFGFFAGIELLSMALRAGDYIGEKNAGFAVTCSYNASILLWFGYMWAKPKLRESPAMLLTSQRWDRSLGDLQYPVASDSLIPMFEGMVEQALSRAHADLPPGTEKIHEETPAEEHTTSFLGELTSMTESATRKPKS